jgi:branched-chain amino acid transport system substrate-binding protein
MKQILHGKNLMLKTRVVLSFFIILVLLLPMSLPAVKAVTTVKIGKISANASNVPTDTVIAQMAIGDINAYMTAHSIAYQFTYELKDGGGSVPTHLQMVQQFNAGGLKFINGGPWSPQAQGSLAYINANDIIMLSPTSTSPTLAIAGDNLFRLCPSDDASAPAMASMIWSYGYTHTIIIWRGDGWGDQVVNYFKPAYTALGGKIDGDSSTRYDPSAVSFSSYLKTAEKQMMAAKMKYMTDKVCILLLAFNEAAQILTEAKSYPNIYCTRWFGGDGTANNYNILNNAPEQASRVRLFSTLAKIVMGPSWKSVADRYEAQTGQYLNSYQAYDYDIYWVFALSIVQAGYVPGGNPLNVKNVLPTVAANHNGASGYCNLNVYGDRPSQGFNIYGFGISGGVNKIIQFGTIDTGNHVQWGPTAFRLYGSASGSVTNYENAYSAKIVKGNWGLSIDDASVKFTLTYSERNLNSYIEQSPIGSVDNFYVTSYGETLVSQTRGFTVIRCMLHFQKDWAKMDGTRATVYFDYPATITISMFSIKIDLPTPIRPQNFDISGYATSFKFN